jgi:acyl carrier protein
VGEARPTTETERVLADEILAGILRLDRVGVTDDFFALGGNSLQAAQLMSRITSTFGVEVSLADFFSSPTVVHLAATIDRLTALTVDDDDLLARIEQMSDAEAALLLKIESRS